MGISEDLTSFQSRKTILDNTLSTNGPDQPSITEFTNKLGTYIRSAGINQSPNSNSPLYLATDNSWKKIIKLLQSYQTLTKDMTASVAQYNGITGAETNEISAITALKGTLNQKNNELQQSQTDLEIAQSRQESVTNAKIDQSFIQGLSGMIGFTHPIKPTSIALLMGLGFFIFFVCGLILKDFFSTSADIASQYFNLNEIVSYLSLGSSRAILVGVVAAFILYAIGLYLYFYIYQK